MNSLLNEQLLNHVIQATGARSAKPEEVIQSLWSGYGEIVRVVLQGGAVSSVVLKYVLLPDQVNHPRGWNTDRSHARKVKSYAVEMAWYSGLSSRCGSACRVPACYATVADGQEQLMVLEDLDAAGFSGRQSSLNRAKVELCLKWLANFHATFLDEQATDLWPVGTYWHLDTRPDELAAMTEGKLKQAASLIDERLNKAQFQTLVHGDAKVANFCFSDDGSSVAAVDFQYVGGGCGMKDVAYFLGSCLGEEEIEAQEKELLDYYFFELRIALRSLNKHLDEEALETEWRALFPLAWTDFYRFLLGWMPGHWKVNDYSRRVAGDVVVRLHDG